MHILNNLKLLLVNCRAMALYKYLIIIHNVIISRLVIHLQLLLQISITK